MGTHRLEKSSANEAYAVGEIGKYYISDDKGLNWLVVSTGYEGSYWSGIKVDEENLCFLECLAT